MPHPPATPTSLSSMGRGFEVISALGELTRTSPDGASVTAVAEHLGRDRSQISRTLSALDRRGYVTREPGSRGYRLAWRWYAEAQEITERRLRTEGLTILDELAESVGESCFIGVLHGADTVTIVESVPSASRMIGSWVGRAYPAYCSDAGQAVLWDAEDDEVRDVFVGTRFDSPGPNAPRSIDDFLERLRAARARGYAIVDQEAEAGLYSVSAPVHDFRSEVVAAIQIVGERPALVDRTTKLGEHCRAAADRLSAALGWPGASA